MLDREVGKGRSIYLNLTPIDYSKLRLIGEGAPIRDATAQVLTRCRLPRDVTVTIDGGPPIGCEVITYTGDGARYIAIMRRPEYRANELGEIGYSDNSRFEEPVSVTVQLQQSAQVRELLSGREFGKTDRVEVTLGPWKPVILRIG
jgi:hypothetical protein